MDKTLYVSDLDGTLLNRQSRLSKFTLEALNRLLREGMLFTFATARSWHSAREVASGLSPVLPWVVHNGAFVVDGVTGGRRWEEFFPPEQRELVLAAGEELGLHPLAYAVIDGQERVLYLEEGGPRHPGMERYLSKRKGDRRLLPVKSPQELLREKAYYFTFIDDQERLAPLWERVRGLKGLNITFQRELYREEYYLEITPRRATKACAALRLKEDLGCDRLVAFGDAMNDLPLFAAADESYAVENAMPEVKAAATGIIGSNQEDGVARFLLEQMGKTEGMG
ncbi:HAD family hydrolase [Acutalibacter sp. 1XD8-33]|uniref:HAD family hydrolase n=1 Tax=Acutalibacter sp. 1XD8-33 TaxID=2320081 RepID=UPI000EA12D93|nr:HAD family hydrolase [Acutalibacter sp. 1XD8-33]RKJ41697.1 HAD family hydrolase [Acutalibacter sp. 1XD8-33]